MLNDVHIAFSTSSIIFLDAVLALVLFGVSLSLRVEDFTRIIKAPRAPLTGLAVQFFVLPASNCLFCWVFKVDPWLALGMQLVASCPSGSFSNVLTFMARGNVALSVSMTAASSLIATVATPLNFAFYSWLNPLTREHLKGIQIDSLHVLLLVALVLALPLMLGMLVGKRYPDLSKRIDKPLRIGALAVFLVFIVAAFANNLQIFLDNFQQFVWLVIAQNVLALGLGYFIASRLLLPEADRRAITIEVAVQNASLALVILFTFYPQAGAMTLVAAFWGVWHMVSGTLLGWWWSRRKPADASATTAIQEA
ncbi:MAG: bile acid:sodium symporter family protein [bacterium]|nr:bile acid:sodium symporter family protein [bacterium]